MAISSISTDATFRAGGLASGMDTNSIIDQLVALESRPLTLLRSRQSGLKTQISALADIASKLSALGSASADLGTNGVLSARTVSTNEAFGATPGSSAVAGRYAVEVVQLARASKWRSQPFAAAATHPAGTLTLTVQGKAYTPLTIAAGTSLADVATAIRGLGAPVSVAVLNDGTSSYLSLTALDTGLPSGGGAALSLAFSANPTLYAETQAAQNASLRVDGLLFSRTSNDVSDVVPGTTLTLTEQGGPAEDLVLATDVDGTKARLQKFVDAYNDVMKLVQRQLRPTKDTDRSASLAGDAAVRSLQSRLQALLTSQVGTTTVRSLADLGVKTARDGSLSIDATVLAAAVSRDPTATNAVFSTASTGVSAVVESLVEFQTRLGDGALVARQDGLNSSWKALDAQAEAMQRRIDAFRKTLIAQFTAMENTVSGLKSLASYLSTQSTSGSDT
jgi:flagellar hook-associated protein 2